MRAFVTAVTLLGLAVPAEGQALRNTINSLFTFGDCGQPLCLDLPNEHGSHFLPSVDAGNATVITFLTEAIGQSVTSTPISASSSGATFSLVAGLPVRTSTSLGPIFGERAQTLGRGRFFLGANITSLAFTTLNGTPLDNILINFTHQDVGNPGLGDPDFENDIIQLRMKLDMNISGAVDVRDRGSDRFPRSGRRRPAGAEQHQRREPWPRSCRSAAWRCTTSAARPMIRSCGRPPRPTDPQPDWATWWAHQGQPRDSPAPYGAAILVGCAVSDRQRGRTCWERGAPASGPWASGPPSSGTSRRTSILATWPGATPGRTTPSSPPSGSMT